MQKPDFVQINQLIQSLCELDNKFLFAVQEVPLREAKIRDLIDLRLKEQTMHQLADIPTGELSNAREGIRVSVLEDAGYRTLLDLYKASDRQLLELPGIGDGQLAAIRRIISNFYVRLKEAGAVRIATDPEDAQSRALIIQIAQYRLMQPVREEILEICDEVHNELTLRIEAIRLRSRLRWIFSRRHTKEETIRAVGALLAYCSGPQFARAKTLLTRFSEAEALGEEAALEDYKKNGASYYALIERLTGAEANREFLYSSVPAELASQIDAFDPDLRRFKGDLRAYQLFGTRYILTMKKVLLGDEMGLGKTIQAIAAMVHLFAGDPESHFLIVCPASVMVNWCREIARFSEIPVCLLHGPQMEESIERWQIQCGAAVTNYESMSRIVDWVNDCMRLSLLVIDEAHYIKNPQAKRTRLIHMLEDESDRILMLTGTPLENRVSEMCELIGFLRPDLELKVREYAGMRHLPAFRQMLAPVYLRRQRDQVLRELPPLTLEEEWCEMTPQDCEAYTAQVEAGNFAAMRRVGFLEEDLRYSSKAQRLMELCKQALDEERKVIVYSYFRETVQKVVGFLGEAVSGTITGSTPVQSRQDVIDRFSEAPGGAVLVCQVQAGGTGLNIQAASIVIFCEPQIKPSLTRQALSRVYRMGQVQNVLVYHLLCAGTVDEAVREMVAPKEAAFDMFAEKSSMADAEADLADTHWVTEVIRSQRERFLPATV